MFIDTHCHIHEPYELPIKDVLNRCKVAGVKMIICVGTDLKSSKEALAFARKHDNAFASIGVHPHEAVAGYKGIGKLADDINTSKKLKVSKVVAVGEIGLDYYYSHSPKAVQIKALKYQIEVALRLNLPIIFHVRDAFEDFWPIFDSYKGIKGVLHSFTDSQENLQKALERGLYIGINGISTFTKSDQQKAMFDAIPVDRMLFETDAPFLTPAPYRGTINEPAYVRVVAEYHAKRRGILLDDIARESSNNAQALFNI